MKFIDLTGQKFGNLLVLKKTTCGKHYKYLCRCDCGNEIEVSVDHLRYGHTQSCGCIKSTINSEIHRTHGKSRTRLYRIWGDMRTRCENPNYIRFHAYGGRGIKVCESWHVFSNFEEWAYQNGYADDATKYECTIERVDVDKDYCPENCTWVPLKKQGYNKTNTRYIEYNGVKKSLAEWSEETGLPASCIASRLDRFNWSIEDALTKPSRKKKGGM